MNETALPGKEVSIDQKAARNNPKGFGTSSSLFTSRATSSWSNARLCAAP